MKNDIIKVNLRYIFLANLRNPLVSILNLLFIILAVSCMINNSYRASAYTIGFLVMLNLASSIFLLIISIHHGYRSPCPQLGYNYNPHKSHKKLQFIGIALIISGSIPVFILIITLGFNPGLSSIFALDYDLITLLRNSSFQILENANLYALEYSLRALLPIGLLILFLSGSVLFIPFFIFAMFLSFTVVSKIYMILLIAPTLLYCASSRRYVMSLVFGAILIVVLSFQIAITNPGLKLPILVAFDGTTRAYILARSAEPATSEDTPPYPMFEADKILLEKLAQRVGIAPEALAKRAIDPISDHFAMELARQRKAGSNAKITRDDPPKSVANSIRTAFLESFEALYDRTVLVPGEVMKQWFNTIPVKQPYFGFCGYRSIALLIGCEYIHAPRRVFEIVYADSYVKRGIIGNLNAPGFLMDYANFGFVGVMLSALLLGLVIAIFSTVFAGNTAFLAVLMPYFALTTEAPISMILNSGGLGLAAIILFLTHRHIPGTPPLRAPQSI